MRRPDVSTNRTSGGRVVFGFGLVLLLGCGGGSPAPNAPTPAPAPEPPTSPFRARLEAALLLPDSQDRIDAIAKVARDAANAGDAAVAREALAHEVLKNTEKDWVIEECALALARAGKISEGTKLSELMKDAKERQHVLKRIANGDFASRR